LISEIFEPLIIKLCPNYILLKILKNIYLNLMFSLETNRILKIILYQFLHLNDSIIVFSNHKILDVDLDNDDFFVLDFLYC
jgi:hypothetical protein